MKIFFQYIIVFTIIIFILPILLTKKDRQTVSVENVENIEDKVEQEVYGKYDIIKLLHTKTNKVKKVKLEEYICNVVCAEMPANYEIEALKAQAIVARTYTIYKVNHQKHDQADICDSSSCCQAWISKKDRFSKWDENERENNWNKIENCVKATKGKVITYNKEPINAFFHANSGGTTEIPKEAWGGEDYPYLQTVQTSGEELYSQFSSEVKFSNEQLIKKLKEKYSDIKIDFENDDIKIIEYTKSGRVKTIKFGNHELSGTETRTILGLKSTNFELKKANNEIVFYVKGYGHGVGMSQTGANTMAKEGKKAEEIIKHFYSDVEIKDINSL